MSIYKNIKEEYKIIIDIDEITEQDIILRKKYITRNSNRWFEIIKDNSGYYIRGLICGDNPTYVASQIWNVRHWKTYKGVIKAIKLFAEKGHWGFGNKFPQYKEYDY